MLTSTKRHLLNNLSLSIISLMLGYALWQSISQPATIKAEIAIPLSFYNTTNSSTLNAPDTVAVTLQGTRKELYKLIHTLAAHIDAHALHKGDNVLTLTNAHLFLPDSVVLLHCVPASITITKT